MSSDRGLHGIIPPVMTPLTESGEVDHAGLRRLVSFLLAGGVHGLFVLGTTGEAPHVTNTQRREVIAAVTDVAGGQVPVLAGVLDTGTRRVLEQVEAAAAVGADYVVATAPFYARASEEETAAHFRAIRRLSPVPVVAYNIPSRTGGALSPDLIAALAADGTVAAVKDSSADMVALRLTLGALAGADAAAFSVLTGSELLVDLALFAGAAGAVPGLSNVDPDGFVRIYDAARRGDWAAARDEQARLCRLFSILKVGLAHGQGSDAAAYGGLKTALNVRGVLGNDVTAAPQTPSPPAARKEITSLLAAAELL